MKEYIFSLVCISFAASLITLLCPTDAALQRGFRFVMALVIICAIFFPSDSIKSILDGDYAENFGDIFGSEQGELDASDFSQIFEEYGSQYVNDQIKKDVCERFNISESDLRAVSSFSMKDGALGLEGITIIISGKAIFKDPHAIEDHISENYGCKCDVAIE